MTQVETTIEIAAPADRVWVFFVPQRMPLWYGAEMDAQIELLDGAPDFAAGQKVKVSGTLRRRGVGFTAVITRHEWMRLLEWQFKDDYGIRGLQRWEMEAVAGGTPANVRIRMTSEFQMPGLLGRLGAPLMRWSVRRRDRAWLARLKQLAEGTEEGNRR